MKPSLLSLESHSDFRGTDTINFDSAIASQLPDVFHIVQINSAFSKAPYTLCGFHYQEKPYAQAKLCWVLRGVVYNVGLNLTTGQWTGEDLCPVTAMYIPKGYAHGYLTLEEEASSSGQWTRSFTKKLRELYITILVGCSVLSGKKRL